MLQRDVRFAGVELDDNTSNTEKETVLNDVINEWQEKGVESKYFKKWTDNAPLVKSENANNYNFKTGEEVVVNSYHGTNQDLTYFDDTKKGSVTNAKSAKEGFWSVADKTTADSYADFASTEQPLAELKKELERAEKRQDWDKFDELTRRIEEVELSLLSKEPNERGAKTYELFVKFKNPYVFNAQNQQFMKIQSDINNAITFAKDNGHDGVIITNLQDKPLLGEYGEQTSVTHYLAFTNTQIKSIDNRGTFDESNPNIYYQSMISGINPKQKVDVVDLSNNFSTDKNLTKKNLSDYVKSLIGNKLQSKDKKAILQFVARSKRIGKKDVYIPDHIANSSKVELNNKGERNTFVNNLTDLIVKSVLIDNEPNKDKRVKPNIDNYLRFYVPVKINNDVFTVRITAENNASKNLFNILNADIYDVIIDKKMPTSVLIPANKQRNLMKPAPNNIITPSQQNSSVEQITIEEMLKGVKSPDGKIYFQSVKVGDNNIATNYDYIHNQVTGEKIEIELNNDIKVDKIEPQEVSSSLPFEISQKPSDNKKALIKSLGVSNGVKIEVVNKNTNEIGVINKATIEKSLSNLYQPDKNYSDKIAILNNIQDVFKTSQLIISHNDTKKDTSIKIKRYANIANVGGKNYLLEIVGKDNGELCIYSINSIDTKNDGNQKRLESSQQLDTVNNRITHIQDVFKSKLIKKYNNDYKQQQNANKVYLQETQGEVVFGNRPKTLEEIHKDVRQRAKGLEYLGYFTQENGKHIIGIMENANPSTIIHELSHSYLEALRNLALTDKNMAVKYEAVKKWLGVYSNQELTKAQHETFARGFEAYVYSGKAPNSKLQEVFTLFKNWLKDIRDYWLNNTDYKMSDEVRKVFDTRVDDVITQAEADKLLDIDIAIKEKEVNSVLKVPVTQGQYDALVSFTFNLGIGNLKKSTLLRLVNQGKYKNASNEFSRWVYAGGKVLAGLVKRRNEEKELFLS